MSFFVLPDLNHAVSSAPQLSAPSPQTITHRSGRPWIVLGEDADDIVLADHGDRKLALIGCTDVSSRELRQVLESVHELSDLDRFSSQMFGAAHLVATFGGTVRAQGTVFNIRRIFQTTVAGVTVLGDCAHEVAGLSEAPVNVQALATRLLVPGMPWPLDGETVWDGVVPVQGGTWQCLDLDGTSRPQVWWSAPEPHLSIDDASAELEVRLRRSVRLRARTPLSTSTDLSGGMDSTSLAFLAAKQDEQVLTFRYDARDPENDDDIWADRAGAYLHAARHIVMDHRQAPGNFDDYELTSGDLEAPYPWFRVRALHETQSRVLRELGSTTHLTGHGGDELFTVSITNDHSAIRSSPLSAVKHLGGNRYLRRMSWRHTLRHLVSPGTYEDWLKVTSRNLDSPLPTDGPVDDSWGPLVRMPSWCTPEAVSMATDALRSAAAQGASLSPWRAQHVMIALARRSGETLRRTNSITKTAGVGWHAPFLDDRVVEAALSVRLVDRSDMNAYKPVLVAAMKGHVPQEILGRPTKSDFSADVFSGFHANKKKMLSWCDDLRLADAGLVDAAALKSFIAQPQAGPRGLTQISVTLAAEAWLRAIDDRPRVASTQRRRGERCSD